MNFKSATKRQVQKVIGLMKNELRQKTMTEFGGLRVKIYSYLIDDCSRNKNLKDKKKNLS